MTLPRGGVTGIAANKPLFDRVRATIADIRRLRREATDLARDLATSPGEEA